MEKPIKMDDLGFSHIFGNTQIDMGTFLIPSPSGLPRVPAGRIGAIKFTWAVFHGRVMPGFFSKI